MKATITTVGMLNVGDSFWYYHPLSKEGMRATKRMMVLYQTEDRTVVRNVKFLADPNPARSLYLAKDVECCVKA